MNTKSEIFSATKKSSQIFQNAYSHSKRVRLLKKLLPFLAFFIGVVFSWFTFFATPSNTNIIIINDAQNADGRLTMTDPKLEGYTNANQPYMVTAARAIQYPSRSGIITLEDIQADIPIGTENRANIIATSGVYDNINGRLQLDKPFTVKTNDDMIANFADADINLITSHLISNKPITIRRNGLNLKANSLQIQENGQLLLFGGGVNIIIDNTDQNTIVDKNKNINIPPFNN